MLRVRRGLTVLLMLCCSCAAFAQKKSFIDWESLKNPILSYPDWSIKDTATVYRDGTLYVFFTAF